MLEQAMLRLSKNKGFTILEVICAIAIFSILSMFTLSTQLNNLRLNEEGKKKRVYISVVEAVKAELINNVTYHELVSTYNQNKKYINSSMLSVNAVKNIGLLNVLEASADSRNPYVKINMIYGEVLSVEIELYYKSGANNQVIKAALIKGNYL
jgi:prepilin-type N-terminal cleavage/methylation domain-containing protein